MTDVLGVVIPARDEEFRIGACLLALAAARAEVARVDDPPLVRVVVVADRCTDRTVALARVFADVEVIEVEHGRVGPARAAGVDRLHDGTAPAPTWLACTDADSRVPSDWLTLQLRHARSGTDLLLGVARLDEEEMTPALMQVMAGDRVDFADGHPHVFGAHFGIRARTYRRARGFGDLDVHEDVRLAEAVRNSGGVVVSTGEAAVVTSARLVGRTPGGVAGYLRQRLLDGA